MSQCEDDKENFGMNNAQANGKWNKKQYKMDFLSFFLGLNMRPKGLLQLFLNAINQYDRGQLEVLVDAIAAPNGRKVAEL